MKSSGRRLRVLALLLTVLILAALYTHIDLPLLLHYLGHARPLYLALALLLFVPQILVSSLRWQTMTAQLCPMGLAEAGQQVMAAKALNAFLPSKLGEMSKAYFLKRAAAADLEESLSAVLLEKLLDLGALCSLVILGLLALRQRSPIFWPALAMAAGSLALVAFLLLSPLEGLGARLPAATPARPRLRQLLRGWAGLLRGWRAERAVISRIIALSLLLWILHLLQIYLFFPTLRHPVPLTAALVLTPMAILVGLLPITLAGMGTRDSALIVLFAPYADPALLAGVGILCSMRYWVDTLLGLVFLHTYARQDAGRSLEEERGSGDLSTG